MPVLFLIAGLILIVTAIRGTTGDFARRFAGDVSGGFLKWLAAIVVIGAMGYVPALKEPSRYLLGLVAVVIILTKGGGFISAFVEQIENPGTATTAAPAGGNANLPALPVQTSGGNSGGSGASSSSSPASAVSSLSTLATIGSFFGL
jgi:hypothetical protein